MLSGTCKHYLLSGVMLNVIMVSVVAPTSCQNVNAHFPPKRLYINAEFEIFLGSENVATNGDISHKTIEIGG
jgi:hypothetical protein